MTNPQLTSEQREQIFGPLFQKVVRSLEEAAEGDERLLWALRRKLAKELTYLERGSPTHRKALKAVMWERQKRRCSLCSEPLELKGSELDRFEAYRGYVESNVRLVHHDCHVSDQESKRFT